MLLLPSTTAVLSLPKEAWAVLPSPVTVAVPPEAWARYGRP